MCQEVAQGLGYSTGLPELSTCALWDLTEAGVHVLHRLN